ncbi:hypothetical protein GE09DRAFT_493875 [Coniochaeta sp. 2T2.1]|nr:hypothetical protein GE09DRAFT_493875 [Coniochaeta sp. 2T2.1]
MSGKVGAYRSEESRPIRAPPAGVGIALARFREKIDAWAPYADLIRVFDKGDIDPDDDTVDRDAFLLYKKLPNKGREGHSWASYICANYERLPEYVIFTQAAPWDLLGEDFDTPEEMFDVVEAMPDNETAFTPFDPNLFHVTDDWDKIDWEDPKQSVWMTAKQLRMVDRADVTPGDYWRYVLGVDPPPKIRASHGGTFCVRREAIQRWPKDVYERIKGAFEKANSLNPEIGFFQERMWSAMFDPKNNWLDEEGEPLEQE